MNMKLFVTGALLTSLGQQVFAHVVVPIPLYIVCEQTDNKLTDAGGLVHTGINLFSFEKKNVSPQDDNSLLFALGTFKHFDSIPKGERRNNFSEGTAYLSATEGEGVYLINAIGRPKKPRFPAMPNFVLSGAVNTTADASSTLSQLNQNQTFFLSPVTFAADCKTVTKTQATIFGK